MSIVLDHADLVTSHKCNNNCKYCIDKFIHQDDREISLETIEKFLKLLRKNTDKRLEVLLLGGEPTMLDTQKLKDIGTLINKYGFSPIMSTNGIMKEKIKEILPYYDWIQITVYTDKDIDYWREYSDKINIKLSGDQMLTMKKLEHFMDYTYGYARKSVSMYFTQDFEELCKDEEVWKLLNDPRHDWQRNGSYEYMFYNGVRFKKGIHGETNIIDEPTVPKCYPNGNYNKTWNHEELDNYLSNGEW
jgi:organic radical activating enzyme